MVNKNTSPYFDDYDADKNFYSILFKPTVPVQTRELNQLQSILQDQVSKFGQHVFVEGSMVKPGELNHTLNLDYVTVSGNLDLIQEQLDSDLEVTLVGTGASAKVVILEPADGTDPATIYLQFISGTGFNDSDSLDVVVNSQTIDNIIVSSSGKGSAITIEEGVFFVNGTFVASSKETKIISKYSQTPSVTVGFKLVEEAITSADDTSLFDNALGTPNFKAPGADRLKLTLSLVVYDNNEEFDKENFIQLVKFNEGTLEEVVTVTEYSILEETLARRTFDESGDYTTDDFSVTANEHDTNTTKATLEVSPGKAYVKGFEIEKVSSTQLEIDKARDTILNNNSAQSLAVGNYIEIANIEGMPELDEYSNLNLYSGTPSYSNPAGGVLEGQARVKYITYDVSSGSGRLYLFNIRNAAGVLDSSFIDNVDYVYQVSNPDFYATTESGLIGSTDLDLRFKLPVDNVKTLLVDGLSDTTYSAFKYFETSADASGNVVLNTENNNSIFAAPSSSNSLAFYVGVDTNNTSVNLNGIATLGGSPTGTTMTIALGANAANRNVFVTTEVIRTIGERKTKTIETNTVIESFDSNLNGIPLNQSDVIEIISILNNSTVDITDNFTLDNGKTDEAYGVSIAVLNDGLDINDLTSGPCTIEYRYYLHSNSGDYFSVDSYIDTDYEDIPSELLGGQLTPMTDVLDFRPSLNDTGSDSAYAISQINDSPFPGTLLRADITQYLPRIDKLVLNKSSDFEIVSGVSALVPSAPKTPDDSMLLYTINIPPYTKDESLISFSRETNKRYTMKDIGGLEKRIENLEYYTSLSLLETETAALQVLDSATGLNRFKNGFFVDSFVNHDFGDWQVADYSASVSVEDKELRPEFNVEYINLNYDDVNSSNVVQRGSLITLPYSENTVLSQNLASTDISVNPYAVYLWEGKLTLIPNSDSWFDTTYTAPDRLTNVTVDRVFFRNWNFWETNWLGTNNNSNFQWINSVDNIETNVSIVGDRVVDQTEIPFMRTIDVDFAIEGMVPNARFYVFFDNVEVTDECKPDGGSYGDAIESDSDGVINGTFTIPNRTDLRFRTGSKRVLFIERQDGNKNKSVSYAEADFTSRGTLVTRTQTILTTTRVVNRRPVDPLAQSFFVQETGGMFVTSIDLYFSKKDDTIPVSVEIRNMENGLPGKEIVPYSKTILQPADVNVSTDASVATRFTFESPVYLDEGNEYCFVIMSNSNAYRSYIATMAQQVIGSQDYISKQPFIGVMFKSQNNSTWTPDQESDIKFGINKAVFETGVNGTAVFTDSYNNTITLPNNPLSTTSGSNLLEIRIPNHGFAVGSRFTLGGVSGSYAGIDASDVNGEQIVTEIVSSDIVQFAVTPTASATGIFGGSAVTTNTGIVFTEINPVVSELLLKSTNINWTTDLRTGMSSNPSATESPFNIQTGINVEPNNNNSLSVPYMVLNANDKAAFVVDNSFKLNASLSSSNPNLSPVIDTNRVGAVLAANKDKIVYVSAVAGLEIPASTLRIIVDAHNPSTSTTTLFYRVGNSTTEISGKDWIEVDVDVPVTTEQDGFIEVEATVENLSSFNLYQVRLEGDFTDNSNVNRYKALRVIALG